MPRHSKLTPEKREAACRDLDALNREASSLCKENKHEEKETKKEKDCRTEGWSEAELAGASPKLKLEESGDRVRGRFVTTKKRLEAGELVFRETPFSLVLLPEHCNTRCNNCLAGPLVAPLSCRRCTQPRYFKSVRPLCDWMSRLDSQAK